MAEKNLKFGELLSELTEEDGLNNRELAKIIGVRPSSIGNYRSGREPQAHILEKLADYFKITSKELRSGEKTLVIAEELVTEGKGLSYVPSNTEEQREVNKLLVILRDGNEEHRQLITHTINILCGDKLWEGEERRVKHDPDHGRPEHRLTIHRYKQGG